MTNPVQKHPFPFSLAKDIFGSLLPFFDLADARRLSAVSRIGRGFLEREWAQQALLSTQSRIIRNPSYPVGERLARETAIRSSLGWVTLRCIPSSIGSCEAIKISADGTTGFIGTSEGQLELWDLPSGTRVDQFRGDEEAISTVSVSPDGKKALTEGRAFRLWDLSNKTVLCDLGEFRSSHLRFTPDGQFAIAASELGELVVLDLSTGTPIELEGHLDPVCALEWTSSTRAISGDEEGVIRLWDIRQEAPIYTFREHSESISCLAVNGKRNIVISIAADGTNYLFDLNTPECLGPAFEAQEGLHPCQVVINQEGTQAFVSFTNGQLHEVDLKPERTSSKLIDQGNGLPCSLSINPEGTVLTSILSNGRVLLWDIQQKKALNISSPPVALGSSTRRDPIFVKLSEEGTMGLNVNCFDLSTHVLQLGILPEELISEIIEAFGTNPDHGNFLFEQLPLFFKARIDHQISEGEDIRQKRGQLLLNYLKEVYFSKIASDFQKAAERKRKEEKLFLTEAAIRRFSHLPKIAREVVYQATPSMEGLPPERWGTTFASLDVSNEERKSAIIRSISF